MKINKLLVLAVSVLIVSSISAAELTLYNQSGDDNLIVWVGYGNNKADKKFIFQPGIKKHHFRVVGHFRDIIWQTSSAQYKALIPSTDVMLMGTINIGTNGRYSLNFDVNGASDKKVRQLVAAPN